MFATSSAIVFILSYKYETLSKLSLGRIRTRTTRYLIVQLVLPPVAGMKCSHLSVGQETLFKEWAHQNHIKFY